MNQFGLGNFIFKFINTTLSNPKSGADPNVQSGGSQGISFQTAQETVNPNMMQKQVPQRAFLNPLEPAVTISELRMNVLASMERSSYLKELMNLPKDLKDVLVLLQDKEVTSKELAQLLTANIDLGQLSELIKQGSKEAMSKLILVMAEASKQGITDNSQLKDAIKFINASISAASQDNPNQILKTFMLLYLPWLPLQEGVDFELEIETSQGKDGEEEVTLTILISTKNYGNIKATLILSSGNSLSIIVNCSEEFPKDELLKRMDEERKKHSIQSEVIVEQNIKNLEENPSRQAKVSISNLKDVNPFLLLMANAMIRHTIELDNQV